MQNAIHNNIAELIIFAAFEVLFLFSLLTDFSPMITWIIASVLIIILIIHSANKGKSLHSFMEKTEQEKEREKKSKKEFQEKLTENKKILHAFSNSFPETILMADSGEKIFFWNPSLYKMFGYSEDEIMGKPLMELFAVENLSWQEISKKKGSDDSDGDIYKALRKDGSEFPASLIVTPLFLYAQQCYFICVKDQTFQKQRDEKLSRLYSTDPLTGLYNRIHFFTLATGELERARRYGHPLSLIITDIDGLKIINKTYGSAGGDSVLKTLTEIVRTSVRNVDIPARLGGGEIALLLPNTDAEKARVTAERLRESVENTIIPVNDVSVSFTISAGIARSRQNTFHMDTLLKDADTALFLAKEKGGNCVETCIYEKIQKNKGGCE
ncbi:MAG: sensor domain-containing diguanylate cyclase [Desulfococcaceae bacterium]|jgi:diguanylate cyclase (GGDEF)-like protein/PAS domain S-box-containing protein|nr:sensor domain-containing diguanylate cyclase [Desulfococcaceae bacterium]